MESKFNGARATSPVGTQLLIALFMLTYHGLASAQPVDEDADVDDALEEVVVTGTRIRRTADFDLPVPVQSLSARDLEVAGVNQLAEAIIELPSVTAALTSETSQSSTQSSGQSTISLRNLGSSRTLTLIDGRRTVGNTSTGSTISLDTIPDTFVERIEVITGGTSAVYGSDAVTGVVNIIMRDDFEGFSIHTRNGTSAEGGNEEYSIEVAAGANFDDDRGNVMFALEWDTEKALFERDRDQAMIALEVDANTNDQPDELEPNHSSSAPGGVFGGNAGDADDPDHDSSWWFFDNGGTGALTPDFSTSRNGFDSLGPETLSIPRDRILVAGKLNYDLAEDVEFFASAHYSSVYTKSERAADTANSGRLAKDFPIYLADGATPHPYVSQQIFDDAVELGRDSVFFRRRWSEHGTRFRESDNDTIRVWTGLQGDFADTWTWEASFGYGEWRRAQSRVGDLIIPNYQASVDVEHVDSRNPGLGLQCADAFARSAGCVPLNPFGLGSVTEESVNWHILRDQLRAKNRTTTASAWVTGAPVELPAGALGLAVGYDYRREQSQTRWDPISTSGGGTVTQQVNQDGEQDVDEFFVEVILPLLSDVPGAETLSVEAAMRYSDYSTIGSVDSHKYGFTWQPVQDVRFRASAAQANRAPNNIELFSRGLGGQGSLNDPCDTVTSSSTGAFDDTCRQDPVITSILESEGIFINENLQVQQPSVGNVELKEETADTLTVGVVFTPRFAEGLNVAIDYYDIEIEDAISEIDAIDILRICYSSGDFGGTGSCAIPIRDRVTGQLHEVTETSLNVNALRTSGIDLTARYTFQPQDVRGLSRIPGQVDLGLMLTKVDELEEEAPVPGSDETFTRNVTGLLGRPEYSSRFSLNWNWNSWNIGWRTSHLGEMLNDDTDRTRSTACAQFNNCGDKIALFLDRVFMHNIRVSHEWLNWGGTDSIQVFGGINNLTNEQGPVLYALNDLVDGAGDVGENAHSIYDQTGRYYYAGLTFMF